MIRFTTDSQVNRKLEALAWLTGIPVLGWFIGNWLLQGDLRAQGADALLLAGVVLALVILSRWRLGLYLFLVWIVFEDFARKYLGNGIYTFFGKDILLAVVYIAFFFRRGPRAEKLFRPRFWLPLVAFLVWATMEAFNFRTPSPIYGLLGLKLYFYYVPLMFIGYALVRTEFELRRFLLVNMLVAGLVSLLGIIQAIFGQQLLNPEVLDENLRDLGDLNRVSPITGLVFNRPTSVFVSDGRFSAYLILMFILGFGAIGYLIQKKWVWSKAIYLCFGLVFTAILLTGVRTALLFGAFSIVAILAAMYWGQRPNREQVRRIYKTLRNLALLGAAGTLCLITFFPSALASRWAFYTETLSLHGRGSELQARAWDYPATELVRVFSMPEALLGRGLGTASLGTQYLIRFLHVPPAGVNVENGYGQILLEIGLPGFIIWLIFSSAVVLASWSVVKRLRNTPLLSLGFAIMWYAIVVMFPLTYVGLSTYQDYIVTAFLWMLIGVLFRLPQLLIPSAQSWVATQKSSSRASTNDQTLFPAYKPLPQPPPKSG
jgi:hypothetical protein